jgi:pimeloyl-ACP methyl ester carboxylesterase
MPLYLQQFLASILGRSTRRYSGAMAARALISLLLLTESVVLCQDSGFADSNGARIYYEIEGEGTSLLLIHGFFESGAMWAPVKAALAAKHRLIIVDMRGHGRSTNPSRAFTHKQSALDTFAVLDKLGIRNVKAMGVSSGGMTLLHMATQQPDRVEQMALVGASSYTPQQARVLIRKRGQENFSGEVLERLRKIHARGDEQIRQLQQSFSAGADNYQDMNFTSPLLSTIKAETLIIHGDRDAFFPIEMAVDMYRSIPRSYLWIIPNGGHIPVFAPLALGFPNIVLDFFGGKWKAH